MFISDISDKSFEEIKKFNKNIDKNNSTQENCKHPEHEPPSFLYIPNGEQHIHKCPHCKREIILKGSNISF